MRKPHNIQCGEAVIFLVLESVLPASETKDVILDVIDNPKYVGREENEELVAEMLQEIQERRGIR